MRLLHCLSAQHRQALKQVAVSSLISHLHYEPVLPSSFIKDRVLAPKAPRASLAVGTKQYACPCIAYLQAFFSTAADATLSAALVV